MYAVVQWGVAILGIGKTIEVAISDAEDSYNEKFSEEEIEELKNDGSIMNGQLLVFRCTEALYNEVLSRGGDIPYDFVPGSSQIIGTEKEYRTDSE